MSGSNSLNFIVKYNPIALFYQKVLSNFQLLADFSQYLHSIFLNKTPENVKKLLFILGVSALTFSSIYKLFQVYKTWGWLVKHIINTKKFSKEKMIQKYGKCWVLITGFTGGIGWGFVQHFAEMGYNLILIGRNPQKIGNRIEYLKRYHASTQFRVIETDFNLSQDVAAMREQLQKIIKVVDLGIVVNNVAVVEGAQYQTTKLQGLLETSNINVRINKMMTEIVLPHLRNRGQRSAIINISSCTGIYAGPFLGIYGTTKRFFNVYNQNLAQQNKDKIDIISPTPFGVTTEMMKMRKGPMMITPLECARSIVCDLLAGERHTFSHFKHKLSGAFCSTMSQQQIYNMYAFFRKKKDDNLQQVKK